MFIEEMNLLRWLVLLIEESRLCLVILSSALYKMMTSLVHQIVFFLLFCAYPSSSVFKAMLFILFTSRLHQTRPARIDLARYT